MNMTNTPTIDGVSRELLADLVKLASRNVRSAWGGGVCEEARALLDTPPNDLREHCKQCAEVVKTWPEWKQNCLGGAPAVERNEPVAYANPKAFENFGRLAHLGGLYAHEWMFASPAPELVPLYRESPEVASLQSTIAQLQAHIAALESERGDWK